MTHFNPFSSLNLLAIAELSFLILIIVFEISYATESYWLIARILSDFTDVPLRDDQREYLCKVADG